MTVVFNCKKVRFPTRGIPDLIKAVYRSARRALRRAMHCLGSRFDHADNGAKIVADLVEGLKTYGGALLEGLSGRQAYFLEVPGTASAAVLSVVSFEARPSKSDS